MKNRAAQCRDNPTQGQLKDTFKYEEQGCTMQRQSYAKAAKSTFEYEEQGCIKQEQPYARAAKKTLLSMKSRAA